MSLIVFVSASGGTGCSTVAAHCANLMCDSGFPTLAIDICSNNGLSIALGNIEIPQYGWSSYERKKDILHQSILESNHGLKLIPYGSMLKKHKKINDSSIIFDEIISKQSFQCFVDVGQHYWENSKFLTSKADLIVVCVKAEMSGFLQIQELINDLKKYSTPFRIVIGRYDVRRFSQRETLVKILKQWPDLVFSDIVHEDEQLSESLNQGVSVHKLYPQAQSAHDIAGVFHSVKKMIHI